MNNFEAKKLLLADQSPLITELFFSSVTKHKAHTKCGRDCDQDFLSIFSTPNLVMGTKIAGQLLILKASFFKCSNVLAGTLICVFDLNIFKLM